MTTFILLVSFLFTLTGYSVNPNNYCKEIPVAAIQQKHSDLVGEWERIENDEKGNISKIIFYPDGKINMLNKKRSEMRLLRYRLLSTTEPIKGEILLVPFGEGNPKDRILFTAHFNNPDNIDFKYTTGDVTQTIYLKKVKDIPHGVIPLSR